MISKFKITQLLFLVFCFYSLASKSQSISGEVSSLFSKKNLGYANVNIYKNEKLIANVLTDEEGKFSLKLDTGLYKCEIVYAGYEKIVKEIRVKADEKADFSLSSDEKSKYAASKIRPLYDLKSSSSPKKRSDVTVAKDYEESEAVDIADLSSSEVSMYKKEKSISINNMWGESVKVDSVKYGKLTAGEINDFSKWNMWTDLSEGELKTYQLNWNISPSKRFTVQLKDKNGLPLANAKVELLEQDNIIYTSKTDNTGKAELWTNLTPNSVSKISEKSIKITYNGETKIIKNAKEFENGINIIVFDPKCEQSQNVDIAIVVDATGSMQDEIDYLKSDLNDLIYKSKKISNTLNFRFANIFYRDNADAYLTEIQNFTNVLSESVAFTNMHDAGGGGDNPEAVDLALDSAINKLSWSSDTRTKILFLVLDAPPHNTSDIQNRMKKLCSQASEKGIRIVPITGSGADKSTEYLMRCLALATNGTYTFLTNHSGIGNSHIKPSTDSYQVEILNDLLVRIIKSYTYMPDCNQFVADLGVNLPDSQVVIHNNIDSTNVDTAKTILSTPINLKDSVELEWKFFPNPTNGIINIVSNKEIKELYISDLSGKVLQIVKNINPETVYTADLSDYSSGIYLIRYPIGKQWISGKIVLLRE